MKSRLRHWLSSRQRPVSHWGGICLEQVHWVKMFPVKLSIDTFKGEPCTTTEQNALNNEKMSDAWGQGSIFVVRQGTKLYEHAQAQYCTYTKPTADLSLKLNSSPGVYNFVELGIVVNFLLANSNKIIKTCHTHTGLFIIQLFWVRFQFWHKSYNIPFWFIAF